MEDLELEVTTDADKVVPSDEWQETEAHEEENLSDDQVISEVERLKEEAKTTEDPKEKRHLEQQAGRLQQLAKARERASNAEKTAKEKEDYLTNLETKQIDLIYEKAMDEKYWLPYFEEIVKTDPKLADKVAKEKWWMTAKQVIKQSKQELAQNGDDTAKQDLTMEEMEAKAEHKIAVREANKAFNDLESDEKEIAQKYFERISWKWFLTIDEAIEFADMAKHYATRWRKPTTIEKEKVIAENATTSLGSKKTPEKSDTMNPEDYKKFLMNAGISAYQAWLIAGTL